MTSSLTRRHFLKAGLGVAGVLAAPGLMANAMTGGCNAVSGRPYGVQMYMLRDMFAKDPAGTIKKLAAAGFKQLEMFGVGGSVNAEGAPLFGLSIDDMADLMAEYKLTVPSVHINSDLEDIEYIKELGSKLNIDYFIEPMAGEFLNFKDGKVNLNTPSSVDEVKAIAARLNKRGQTMKELGFKFAYHNHNFEFDKVDGQVIFDIMMENTDPELVKIELDLGWVAAAGHDPVAMLNKYKGRVIGCHMKDYDGSVPLSDDPRMIIPEMSRISTPGDGKSDSAAIVKHLNENNVKYRYVEVDVTDTPFEDAVRGLCHLSALG